MCVCVFQFQVLGWGITENDTFSEHLKLLYLPVVSDVNCIAQQEIDFRKFVTYTSFCAGFANGAKQSSLSRRRNSFRLYLSRVFKFQVQEFVTETAGEAWFSGTKNLSGGSFRVWSASVHGKVVLLIVILIITRYLQRYL